VTPLNDPRLETFREAFSPPLGSCRATCHCGHEFWNEAGWDFEEGEVEKLKADRKATELAYAVSYVEFEGRTYVGDCTCWHVRALRIVNFLESHGHSIAEWFRREKDRRQAQATAFPTIGEEKA
jgi:hypothetical protein